MGTPSATVEVQPRQQIHVVCIIIDDATTEDQIDAVEGFQRYLGLTSEQEVAELLMCSHRIEWFSGSFRCISLRKGYGQISMKF